MLADGVDPQIERPPAPWELADGALHKTARPRRSRASRRRYATAVEAIPASGFVAAFDDAADVDNNFALVSPILRAGSLAIVAFQAGYTLLDRIEFPQNFPRTGPLHIESIMLGLIALAASLSPWDRPMAATRSGDVYVDHRQHGVDCGDRRRLRRAGRFDSPVFLRRRLLASMGPALAGGARNERPACHVRVLDDHGGSRFESGDRLDDGYQRARLVADNCGPEHTLSTEIGRASRGARHEPSVARARDGTARGGIDRRANAITFDCRQARRCCGGCSTRTSTA